MRKENQEFDKRGKEYPGKACAACGLICVRYMTDTTLKTEDDLKRYLDIPVLSVIPYYEEKKE